MKKHFLYVSTAALLAMSFASCVDNDEPRGLRELRYAKANQWNAQAERTRALITPDSMAVVLTNRGTELTNQATELTNYKTEMENKIEIEKKQYALTVSKCSLDVEIAKYQYALALENVLGPDSVENAKAKYVASQLALKVAEEAYNKWVAETKIRQAEYAKEISDREIALQYAMLKYQDSVDRYALAKAEYKAKFDSASYVANLKNLIIVATANLKVWKEKENEVWSAYANLKEKEDSVYKKTIKLTQAQQALAIAMNQFEKDSATNLKILKDKVNDAQYTLDWAQRSVTLAEQELTDFETNCEDSTKNWVEKYIEYQDYIDGLEYTDYGYDVSLAEARAVYSADSIKYESAKKDIDKPLDKYNGTRGYYTFILADAIADDKTFALPAAADSFKLDKGVIATPKGILNKNLSAQLKAILDYIGDDKNSDNNFYLNEKGIKAQNDNIKTAKNSIAATKKQLTKDTIAINAKINAKYSSINTMTQQLEEYENQDEIETKFNDQKEVFEDAVTAYKAAAIAYKWADVAGSGNGKSTYYELVAAPKLAAAIVAFNKAYAEEEKKEAAGDPYNYYSDAMNKLRKDIQSAANNAEYWDLRTAFDGKKRFDKTDDPEAKEFYNFSNWANNSNPGDIAISTFDGYVLVTNHKDPDNDEVNNKVKTYLGGNDRQEIDGGAFKAYVDAAKDFIGAANNRYVAYDESEIAQKSDDDLSGLGTTGEYNLWLRKIAALNDKIAKAKSDDEKYPDDDPVVANRGQYKNPGIAQYKEQIADKLAKALEDTTKERANIDTAEMKIANSALWKALYDEIAEVKDANDDETKRLTIEKQEAYKTDLASLEETLAEDQKKIDEWKNKKNILASEKKYKEIARKAYEDLAVKKAYDSAGTNHLTGDDIEAKIIIKYAKINLQFAIDEAQESVDQAELDLKNAEKDLQAFKDGEYDLKQNNYIATLLEKQSRVRQAQLDYDHAVKECQVAQAYYDEILEAIDLEEE